MDDGLAGIDRGPVVKAVLSHRCTEHADVAPLNTRGRIVTHHPVEGVPTYRALDAMAGECGACLGEEVDAIWTAYLDALDLVADLLRAHAELRFKQEAPRLILPPGVK